MLEKIMNKLGWYTEEPVDPPKYFGKLENYDEVKTAKKKELRRELKK